MGDEGDKKKKGILESFDEDQLSLTLSPYNTRCFPSSSQRPSTPPPPPPPQQQQQQQPPPPPPPGRQTYHSRRNPTQAHRDGKPETILPPTPWATEQRATVYPLEYLVARGITNITGESQCKRCDARHLMTYDLEAKFAELTAFIGARTHLMHDRAPDEWLNPVFPACPSCAQPNCMRPVIAAKKRDINWLFMLLGQTLGCCTLEQLKYFCKHTGNHRTGAKNRVLYFTYLGLCKQLLPSASFHVYPEPKSKSRQIFNPSDI
ncbi:uncharacterized protein [Typha angustifolia]|uniref:uncharacterized protein n=1 Tax=Typha angustifolia TaxID=59011 RepID=UPI003C2C0996